MSSAATARRRRGPAGVQVDAEEGRRFGIAPSFKKMSKLRVQLGAVLREQFLEIGKRAGKASAIRVLYPRGEADKRVFDLGFRHGLGRV